MRLVKTPWILPLLFPWGEWKRPVSSGKAIYLTFDDGPVPEATPFVLETLAHFNAKATFFCVGDNAVRHPSILSEVKSAGHLLGNHTHNHLDGWKTKSGDYLANIDRCNEVFGSSLFRPPYGHLNISAAPEIIRKYRVIFWDVISYDFDKTLSPELCMDLTYQAVQPGSIVVFHDSAKAMPRLEKALPSLLEKWSGDGYHFAAL